MKKVISCIALYCCFAGVYGQKEVPLKKTDVSVVNQKLVQVQATAKKLEKTLNEAKALMNDLQLQKDALRDMNKEDMYWLQKLMEKKSQLEQMISNTMKTAAEAQGAIAKNLKAS